MADTAVATPPAVEAKVETPIVTPVTEAKVEAPKVDLVTRVSQYKSPEAPKQAVGNEFGLTSEDYEKVKTDPVLSKFYKSMESGLGKKFQEVAELRKSYEAEKVKLQASTTWTPQRVQELLNKDKSFVESAQALAQQMAPAGSGVSDSEWSAMTPQEKAQLSSLRSEVNETKALLLQRDHQAEKEKQDSVLKQKYADYAPDIVDTTISKLVQKEVNATREDIWKVINYEKDVTRAYELGKHDASLDLREKVGASSMEGFSTTTPEAKVEAKQGESNKEFFRRIVLNNILKNRK